MKKIKNKFILGVISIIILILSSQVILAFSHNNVDTNSYVILIKGFASVNEVSIEKDVKQKLYSGDKIHVLGDDSLAVIEWGDGSLTRLGANTKILIEQNEISRDYTKINISFELIAGKTWSNVISFIGKDSSFTQSFEGMEAGVRGTIFDVDLENDYIHVNDHQVVLTNAQGEEKIVSENSSLQLSTFTLLNIQEFIESFQDISWMQLNEKYDAEYFIQLKEILQNSIQYKESFLFILDWISPKYRILYELDTAQEYNDVEILLADLNVDNKIGVYTAVLSRYQDFNFVSSADYEFYKRKVFYRKALIFLGENSFEEEQLVKSAAYDLDDILSSGQDLGIQETLDFLSENKDTLSNIDISFMQESLNKIPLENMETFQEEFESLKLLFPEALDFSRFGNMDSLKDNAEQKVKNFLNDTQSLIEQFKNK